MSWQAVEWAYEAPHLLTDTGAPDTTARSVLVNRAYRADADGRNTYAGPDRVARETGFNERTVREADKRLIESGHLIPDGTSPLGTVNYRINLALKGSDTVSPHDKRAQRHRDKNAARQQAFRDRQKAQIAAERQERARLAGQEIDDDVSMKIRVTPSGGVTHAEQRRYVTPSDGVSNAVSALQTVSRTTQVNHPRATPGGTLPPDPLRPHSPPARGTDQQNPLADPLTPAQDHQSESLPRVCEPALRLVDEGSEISREVESEPAPITTAPALLTTQAPSSRAESIAAARRAAERSQRPGARTRKAG